MSSALIVSKLDQVAIDLNSKAVADQQVLIQSAKEITSVSDEFGQACAVDCLRDINCLLKLVEKSRTEVKAPVLDIGRKIDGLAKNFSNPLTVEVQRINKLVTAYQVAERQKAEALERARQAELARIEAERRAAIEAEAKRLRELQEAQDRAHEAFTKAERKQAEQEAAALAAKADEERKRIDALKAEQAKAQIIQRAPEKPIGLVVKDVWKFEVTNIWELASRNADLVRIEPNASAINAAISRGLRTCPGLRIYSETQTGVRV